MSIGYHKVKVVNIAYLLIIISVKPSIDHSLTDCYYYSNFSLIYHKIIHVIYIGLTRMSFIIHYTFLSSGPFIFIP